MREQKRETHTRWDQNREMVTSAESRQGTEVSIRCGYRLEIR